MTTGTPDTCPFHHATLPGDGTPLTPSPSFDEWRRAGAFVPLAYQDGHTGLIATRYDAARSVLEDRRFSMRPSRMPVGPDLPRAPGDDADGQAVPLEPPGDLDAAARASEDVNLLTLDGEAHARLRRAVTPRFSLRQARTRTDWITRTVEEQIAALAAAGAEVDLWQAYAKPIAARTHCHVIGIPDAWYDRFVLLFVDPSTAQQKYDFIRELLDVRLDDPGEDVVSDLLAAPDLTRIEVEGLLRLLLGAGRDSVAYLITTAAVALLTHPDQLALLRREPDRIASAVEEFMRAGAMFVTLFGRTTLEDVEIDGRTIPAGTTVSVSPVAANRDPDQWDEPARFDVTRDAFGHLGFGHGIHGCIGQQLARIEIREAVSALLSSFPDLRLVDAEQTSPMPFAHPVAVYEAGAAIVDLGVHWRDDRPATRAAGTS